MFFASLEGQLEVEEGGGVVEAGGRNTYLCVISVFMLRARESNALCLHVMCVADGGRGRCEGETESHCGHGFESIDPQNDKQSSVSRTHTHDATEARVWLTLKANRRTDEPDKKMRLIFWCVRECVRPRPRPSRAAGTPPRGRRGLVEMRCGCHIL